ncbi:hydrolase/acyltransferase [Paenibacillus sp. FJAT-26967]|uniref:hydrolase/acyltransferase n=1 Tax=Paenibacillus sp. FJAT-26967 TaxID=1729690 RepID=UPI000838709F|nr:hydrolase/acyltransferase [Paenibacillus sp. FJAT-26967]
MSNSAMRYAILKLNDSLEFVEMPGTHMYQLTALNRRLHKEIEKLTAHNVPALPSVIAECDNLELVSTSYTVTGGLDYINKLETTFAAIKESAYPLISLLTEIRALQAQLEQWYEEYEEENV